VYPTYSNSKKEANPKRKRYPFLIRKTMYKGPENNATKKDEYNNT
jgi:hypothetical protein